MQELPSLLTRANACELAVAKVVLESLISQNCGSQSCLFYISIVRRQLLTNDCFIMSTYYERICEKSNSINRIGKIPTNEKF